MIGYHTYMVHELFGTITTSATLEELEANHRIGGIPARRVLENALHYGDVIKQNDLYTMAGHVCEKK